MIDTVLWCILVSGCLIAYAAWRFDRSGPIERFINQSGKVDGSAYSTVAIDAAPTASEVKTHYKNLLIYIDADLKKDGGGNKGMRLVSDFRDRHFKKTKHRHNFKTSDVLDPWPTFLVPLDTSIKQDPPTDDIAADSERAILAFIQKNYPQEDEVDEGTRSMVRNLIEDIAYRFVYDKDTEKMQLRSDYMKEPLLTGWKSPISTPPKKQND